MYKIGAIIGAGGKIIKEIIERTGTEIDIEDDGTVKVFGTPGESLEKAMTLEGDYTVYPGHGMSTTLKAEQKVMPYWIDQVKRTI